MGVVEGEVVGGGVVEGGVVGVVDAGVVVEPDPKSFTNAA